MEGFARRMADVTDCGIAVGLRREERQERPLAKIRGEENSDGFDESENQVL